MDSIGLPHDAPRYKIAEKMNWKDDYIDSLFQKAGLSPRDLEATRTKQMSDTMDSHRLAWYAASVSPEKAEMLWKAFSRRYFLGKDTQIRPIRLDSTELLVECAKEVGIDLNEARRVLETDVYRTEISNMVRQLQAAGIESIPVVVFDVDGVATDSWLRKPKCRGREIYHGSGSKSEFRAIFERLHASCASA
eukprot:gnl/TRDRNA2_/TRDRNA2_93986_c0_seq1.p1 gnl/TRDRNA2_/TRDRNA2_93986_c0~~gnl/TRDRNA2_/TRDRNA2_93986_c0_seq1.p1  ORF type:complete len:192 (+),score=26.51 gnl/TRDRNA2_/TRDRNA2_93986_c0_seq1:363-938(+)